MLNDVEACFTSFKSFVGLMHNFTHYDGPLLPYYMKFWRHVNLAILKNPYLATL